MLRIEDVDENFRSYYSDEKLIYIDCLQTPAKISGFPWLKENGNYHRLPDRLNHLFSPKLFLTSKSSSGGCIRFKTNTHVIGFKVTLEEDSIDGSTRMPENASCGMDLYVGEGKDRLFRACINAKREGKCFYHDAVHLSDDQVLREITVNMPLYAAVKKVEIGVDPDAYIDEPSKLDYEKPVVFYGSSITQGGSASRPGNNYTALLARKFGFDQINLGFSGSAKGESFVAELIAGLDMQVFVMDYDHNARKDEELISTHEPFFQIIRRKQPDLPVIFITRPNTDKNTDIAKRRREIIRKTFDNAIAAGDKRVFFIDGFTLFETNDRDCCTVDGNHPNDLGFYRMYETISPVLGKALTL